MLAKPVDPQRFQRSGLTARQRLQLARRRTVTTLEAAHRDRYPATWEHLAQLNQPHGIGY